MRSEGLVGFFYLQLLAYYTKLNKMFSTPMCNLNRLRENDPNIVFLLQNDLQILNLTYHFLLKSFIHQEFTLYYLTARISLSTIFRAVSRGGGVGV